MKLTSLTTVSFIDPAGGKTPLKKQRARQAIVTVSGDDIGRVFVREAWFGRVPTEELVTRVAQTFLTFQPSIMGCEANAMQELFSDTVVMLLRARGVKPRLIPVYQPTKIEKDQRIRWILQPVIAYGRLFLQAQHDELKKEIITFPQGRLKDLVDCLASCITLLPTRSEEKQKTDRDEALAAYLRRSGVDPRFIQRRLDELKRERPAA